MEKPLGTDEAESRDLVARLKPGRLGAVVNFTQASSRGFEELRRAIDAGETGELVGIDIVVTYPVWPRAWPADADWLRLRAEGGAARARSSRTSCSSRPGFSAPCGCVPHRRAVRPIRRCVRSTSWRGSRPPTADP